MISIFIGVAIIVLVIVILIFSVVKTPKNLRGFYGLFYWLFVVIGIIAGVLFILGGSIWGWNF